MNLGYSVYGIVVLVPICVSQMFFREHDESRAVKVFLNSIGPAIIEFRQDSTNFSPGEFIYTITGIVPTYICLHVYQ